MNIRKINSNVYLTSIGCVAVVLLLVSRFWALDKGLILSDDGWYLTLIRDNPKDPMSTRFFKIFQFGVQNDFYKLRLICYVLQILSLFLFGYSIYYYKKSIGSKVSLLLSLGVVALGSLGIPAISTPNYINLNLVFGLLSVSFAIFWLSKRQSCFIILSSFFTTCLFLAQPTSLILLPILFLFFVFQTENKWKDICLFIAGCIMFCIVYFFVETPEELYSSVMNVAGQTVERGSENYGIVFLFVWSIVAFLFIFKLCISGYAYLIIRKFITKNIQNEYMRYILLGIVLGVIVVYVNYFVGPYRNNIISLITINQLGIPFLLLFLMIFENIKKAKKSEILLVLLLSAMPYILSFGTNVAFSIRYGGFLVFLMPIILVLFESSYGTKKIALLYYSICLFLALFSFKKPNWAGDIPSKQIVSVKSIGIDQNIKLSPKRIKQLQFCQRNIDKDVPCFTFHTTWGIVALLDLKPLTYDFKVSPNVDWSGFIDKYMITHDKLSIIATCDDDLSFIGNLSSSKYNINQVSDVGIVIVQLNKNNVTSK